MTYKLNIGHTWADARRPVLRPWIRSAEVRGGCGGGASLGEWEHNKISATDMHTDQTTSHSKDSFEISLPYLFGNGSFPPSKTTTKIKIRLIKRKKKTASSRISITELHFGVTTFYSYLETCERVIGQQRRPR